MMIPTACATDMDTSCIYEGISGPIYKVDQVPEHFHEHYIIRGYRHPKSTAKQCILSVFDPTNETLNFWTHFLPSWYFLWVLKRLSETFDFRHDCYTWPLLTYMFCTVILPLTSSVAHTFNSMSNYMRHICFFVDYGALSAFSLGVAISYRAYVFPKDLMDTWLGENFVKIAALNSILCILMSCQTRFMKPSQLRQILRLSAFAWPYFYDCIPVFYRILFAAEQDYNSTAQFLHKRQFLFAALAAFLYATHIPERLNPGTFDIIGHSHQLFHVCTILSSHDQMQALLLDMKHRTVYLHHHWDFGKLSSSIGIMVAVMILNIFIMFLFSIRLKSFIKKSSKKM